MKVIARLKNYRVTPQKARLLNELVQGYDVDVAIAHLGSSTKRFAHQLSKLILSAQANAHNNNGLDKENMFVESMQIGEGVTYKRWMPRAYGRATPIMKRTSNVVITLEEREEGKGRLSSDEVKKKKATNNKKVEEVDKKKDTKKELGIKKSGVEQKGQGRGTAAAKEKMFRRKSV